ncbi:transposase [Streptomyces wedmorensis]|uniref:transposase n=1 Tax=Streptomyces wedmorensis TaxID=43759 RepID=UPI0034146B47
MDGIRWRIRTGAPWRDVLERYGPWGRVYDLSRRWQRKGSWAGIVTRLQAEADAKGLIASDVNVDSTVCRAHQHAAGAAKRGSPKGATWRCRHRTSGPWPRMFLGRADQ